MKYFHHSGKKNEFKHIRIHTHPIARNNHENTFVCTVHGTLLPTTMCRLSHWMCVSVSVYLKHGNVLIVFITCEMGMSKIMAKSSSTSVIFSFEATNFLVAKSLFSRYRLARRKKATTTASMPKLKCWCWRYFAMTTLGASSHSNSWQRAKNQLHIQKKINNNL